MANSPLCKHIHQEPRLILHRFLHALLRPVSKIDPFKVNQPQPARLLVDVQVRAREPGRRGSS